MSDNTLSTLPQVSTMADSDVFIINVGGKQRLVSKSDLEAVLDVTSTQVVTGFVNDTTTAYVPTSTDVGKWIRLNNASAITVTINAASSQGWNTKDVLYFFQLGAGNVTIAAGAGVTLNGVLTTTTQYQSVACIHTGNDVWDVVGVV